MKYDALITIALFVFLGGCASENDDATAPELQPKGEYRLLPLETTRRQVDAILQGDDEAVSAVQIHPEKVTPPVLFALAFQQFQHQHYHDAMFWYFTAQLRARSDANKSLDRSTQQGVSKLSEQFGADISAYAQSHPQAMEQAMIEVLKWDKKALRAYNPRWVALHGNEVWTQQDYAFMPMDRWAEINRQTRDDFARGFARQMVNLRKGSGLFLPNEPDAE